MCRHPPIPFKIKRNAWAALHRGPVDAYLMPSHCPYAELVVILTGANNSSLRAKSNGGIFLKLPGQYEIAPNTTYTMSAISDKLHDNQTPTLRLPKVACSKLHEHSNSTCVHSSIQPVTKRARARYKRAHMHPHTNVTFLQEEKSN